MLALFVLRHADAKCSMADSFWQIAIRGLSEAQSYDGLITQTGVVLKVFWRVTHCFRGQLDQGRAQMTSSPTFQGVVFHSMKKQKYKKSETQKYE